MLKSLDSPPNYFGVYPETASSLSVRIFAALCKHVGFESHTPNLKHHPKTNMHFKPQWLTARGGGYS